MTRDPAKFLRQRRALTAEEADLWARAMHATTPLEQRHVHFTPVGKPPPDAPPSPPPAAAISLAAPDTESRASLSRSTTRPAARSGWRVRIRPTSRATIRRRTLVLRSSPASRDLSQATGPASRPNSEMSASASSTADCSRSYQTIRYFNIDCPLVYFVFLILFP